MARFTSTGKHTLALSAVELPKTESKRLHLVGVKARKSADITLVASHNITASINSSPFDGPNGVWIVDIKGIVNGNTTLQAKFGGIIVASVVVKVFTKTLISLPAASTQEGMLSRLFLVENISPGNTSVYKESESKKSMLWMRKVIDNRLNHKTPNIFGAVKKSGQSKYTVYDIVKAKNQFHGFENYPNILAPVNVNINGILKIANDYNHSKRKDYATFLNNAVSAASHHALKGFTDPSPKGLYGWRTKGSSAPGGQFKVFKDLAGQTFYTLQ